MIGFIAWISGEHSRSCCGSLYSQRRSKSIFEAGQFSALPSSHLLGQSDDALGTFYDGGVDHFAAEGDDA